MHRRRRRPGRSPLRLVHRAGRYAWAAPNTVVGLALGLLGAATGGRLRRHDGVLEACGGLLDPLLRRAVPIPGGARALTLGHVVLARTAAAARATRPHERVHVRQYERWGILFVPAYLACGAWAIARGKDAYRDNPFEREAFAIARAEPSSSAWRPPDASDDSPGGREPPR